MGDPSEEPDPVDSPCRLRLAASGAARSRDDQVTSRQDPRHRSTPRSSTSAFSNQKLMPISRYIVLGGRQVLLGLRVVAGAAVELAETEVAVGDEGAHPEFGGQRDAIRR